MTVEPGWRTVLCWGAVLLLLAYPLVCGAVALTAITFRDLHWMDFPLSRFAYLERYETSLAPPSSPRSPA